MKPFSYFDDNTNMLTLSSFRDVRQTFEIHESWLELFAHNLAPHIESGDLNRVRDRFDLYGVERVFQPDLLENIAVGVGFFTSLDFQKVKGMLSVAKSDDYQSGNVLRHDDPVFGVSCFESALLVFLERWAEADFGRFNAGIFFDREREVPKNYHYMVCSPVRHFQNHVITFEIAQELINGKTLLSVGAGPAFLERTLVSRFQVPAENIELADYWPKILPQGIFKTHQFDMNNEWPSLSRRFDYIIFPEAVFMNVDVGADYADFLSPLNEAGRGSWIDRVCQLVIRAMKFLNPLGQIRIKGIHVDASDGWLEAKIFREIKGVRIYFDRETLVVQKL